MLNLTQHLATADQLSSGVINLPELVRPQLTTLLTFDDLPEPSEIWDRAGAIADIASQHQATTALIGGALWLMTPLAQALQQKGITAYFAFSKRVTTEEALSDGSVQKVTSFRHAGFVTALTDN